jgi:hypothetical protein
VSAEGALARTWASSTPVFAANSARFWAVIVTGGAPACTPARAARSRASINFPRAAIQACPASRTGGPAASTARRAVSRLNAAVSPRACARAWRAAVTRCPAVRTSDSAPSSAAAAFVRSVAIAGCAGRTRPASGNPCRASARWIALVSARPSRPNTCPVCLLDALLAAHVHRQTRKSREVGGRVCLRCPLSFPASQTGGASTSCARARCRGAPGRPSWGGRWIPTLPRPARHGQPSAGRAPVNAPVEGRSRLAAHSDAMNSDCRFSISACSRTHARPWSRIRLCVALSSRSRASPASSPRTP